MTEFEQCMLMTMKEIKSHLSDIASNTGTIAKEFKYMNEINDNTTDPGIISYQLEKINKTLNLVKEIALEKL